MANKIVRVRMQKFFQYEVSSEAEALEKAKQEDLSGHIQYQVLNSKSVDTENIEPAFPNRALVEKLKSEEAIEETIEAEEEL